MSYPISSSLLDGIVLAVVERESTYGYRITPVSYTHLDVYKRQPSYLPVASVSSPSSDRRSVMA